MDSKDMQGWLNDHLAGLDWAAGVTKEDLVTAVEDDEALRNVIGQYVTEGTYGSIAEVMAIVPVQAWQDAQGDQWRGGESYDADATPTGFRDGPVGRDEAGTVADEAGAVARSAIDAIGRPAKTSRSGSAGATRGGRSGVAAEDVPTPSPATPTLPDPAAAVSPRAAGVAPELDLATPPAGGTVGGDALSALRDAGVSPATLPRPSDTDPGVTSPTVGASDGPVPAGSGSGGDRASRPSAAASGPADFTSTGEKGFLASRQAGRAAASPGKRPATTPTPITGQGVLADVPDRGSAPPPPLGGVSSVPPAAPVSPAGGISAASGAVASGGMPLGSAPAGGPADDLATGAVTASGDPGTARAMDPTDAPVNAEGSDTSGHAGGEESAGWASRAVGAVESAISSVTAGTGVAKEKLASGTEAARSTLASGTEAARATITSITPKVESARSTIASGTGAAKEKLAAGVEVAKSSPLAGPDPTGQVTRAAKGALASLPPRYAALGLSFLNEGAGQYYNGQRGKAGAFAAAGLLLSVAGGMETWLPRDIIGLPGIRLGPRRPRPLLVAAWGALYTYGLWDAWTNAADEEGAGGRG